MRIIILYDGDERGHLLPFTFTRPVANLRIGILTINEKWEKYSKLNVFFHTQDYLQSKFPFQTADENIWINGSIIPNSHLCNAFLNLKTGEALYNNQNELLGYCVPNEFDDNIEKLKHITIDQLQYLQLKKLSDIFSLNEQALKEDFDLLTVGRTSQNINNSNKTYNDSNIFIEDGAVVESSILNAKSGPIYIGKDSEVMEGTIIRGGFALCEHASTKLATKIYGATTVGPHSKVGGELNNVVIWGYSNKGHDGFLGNAVIGEWCNLGADTNNSNLKNNYAQVKLWNYVTEKFENTGQTFCGLMMADHAKCGINTMFHTGTVVGVAANIFGSGFPRNFIPSFSWGGAQGFDTFQLPKVYEMARLMCMRRQIEFTSEDEKILNHIFNQTQKFRFWEKK